MTIWAAIEHVSTWVSLIAFLAAIAAWAFKVSSDRDERLIRSAAPDQRAELVKKTIEHLIINTENLTKDQQYNLALEQIHARARRFKITSLVICFLAVAALAVTAYAMKARTEPPPQPIVESTKDELRFDVKLDDVKFFKIGKKIRTQITLHAIPLTKNNNETATIFTGMIAIHNEETYDIERDSKYLTCRETPSCLYAKIYDEYLTNPIVIRGGDSNPANITSVFDIPAKVKLIRIAWTFYQKEANGQKSCIINHTKTPPIEGIPFLKVVTTDGTETTEKCWKSTDLMIKPVTL